MERPREPARGGADPRTILLFAAAIIAALHFGQNIFIPLAVAVLLSFVLAPLVRLLRRIYLPRLLSVLLVVTVAFLIVTGIFGIVADQLRDLASNLPRYEYTLRNKIRSIELPLPADSGFERAFETLREVGEEIERKATPEENGDEAESPPAPAGPTPTGSFNQQSEAEEAQDPSVVRIAPQPQSAWETVKSIAGPLFNPLATAGLVLVLVVFMLLKREDLRDRVIRLAGAQDVVRTTAAIDDAASRISRYLLMHLIINVTYGIPVALGLWVIGVPNPLLWGLLATVLRFIPYAGPVISAIMPIALAFAVDPGWSMVLMTIALLIALEVVSNNVMEPWLYGSSTGLSSIAIIAGAVFWVTLWGPVGLLLATPLTVCLVVLGRHVPHLSFLNILLGSAPALPPEIKLYQRLLAGDEQEVEELTEELAERMGLEALCDDVLISVLALAEQDRRHGTLSTAQQEQIGSALVEILNELIVDQGGLPAEAIPTASSASDGGLCLLVAARHRLDEAAANLLCRLLQSRGIRVAVVSPRAVARRALADLEAGRVDRLLVCYISPVSLHHPRRMLRRLRAVFPPPTPAGLCLLHAKGDATQGALPEDVERITSARMLLDSIAGKPADVDATSAEVRRRA